MYKIVHIGYDHKHDDIRIVKKECSTLSSNITYDVVYLTSSHNCAKGDYSTKDIKIKVLPVSNRRIVRVIEHINNLYKELITESPDVCHIHEFYLFPLIKKLKRLNPNIKIILDFHENETEDITYRVRKKWGKYLSRIVYFIFSRYEKKSILASDGIIVVTPQMIEQMGKYGKPCKVIPNYPLIEDKIQERNLDEFKVSKGVICFAGGISPMWNHENILRAMGNIENVNYLLAGRMTKQFFENLSKLKGWGSTKYYGTMSHEQVLKDIYGKAEIGMALAEYRDNWLKNTGTLGNNKLFEFMQSGLPVICTDFTLWKEIVEEHDCGIAVNPTDIQAICNAIEYLSNNPQKAYEMGRNGQKIINEKYNWDIIKEELIELYKIVLK